MPSQVLDDVLLLARGNLALCLYGLGGVAPVIRVSRQAVQDFRDIRVAADSERAQSR
jgi:hypothetical protein